MKGRKAIMDTLKNTHKHSIIKLMQSILIMAILACIITTSLSLNVYAGTETLVEGMYSDESNLSGSASSSGYWYSTYCKGGGYLGQGVLVYLLYRNGGAIINGKTLHNWQKLTKIIDIYR
jgi:hypothetical protein